MRSTRVNYRQEYPAAQIDANWEMEKFVEERMTEGVMVELGKWLKMNGPAVVGRPHWDRYYSNYMNLNDPTKFSAATVVKEVSIELWPLDDPYEGFDKVAGPVLLPVEREWFR